MGWEVTLLVNVHRIKHNIFPQHFLVGRVCLGNYLDYPEQFALWNYVSSIGAFISFGSFLFFFGIIFYTLVGVGKYLKNIRKHADTLGGPATLTRHI